MVTIMTVGERINSPCPERRKFYVFSTAGFEETLDALESFVYFDIAPVASTQLGPLATGRIIDNKQRTIVVEPSRLEISITTNRHWGVYTFLPTSTIAIIDGVSYVFEGEEAIAARRLAAARLKELVDALTGQIDANVYFNGRPVASILALL